MCFIRARKEKEVIRTIKEINRKLSTSFSYGIIKEETELLKKIPKERLNSNLRNEHLSYALFLLKKGIGDENYLKGKKKKNAIYLDNLFKAFQEAYIDYLISIHVLVNPVELYYVEVESCYETRFNHYSPMQVTTRLEEIDKCLSILQGYKKKLEFKKNASFKEESLNQFLSLEYYGPMSLYLYIKKIQGDEKKNPFNRNRAKRGRFYYNYISYKKNCLLDKNYKKYFEKEVDLEELRFKKEKNRIISNKETYDYYFDFFMWRYLNDIEFLFEKKLGGIRKVIDLVNIYVRDKGLNKKEPSRLIEVNVDDIQIVADEKSSSNNSSGGKRVAKNQIIIDEFNEEINDNVKKEQILRQNQEINRRRER